MTCGIYEIVNTLTKCRYIGQSKRIEERWIEHRRLLERGEHRHQMLQQAWNEHGCRRFRWRILEELSVLSSNMTMHARERIWMHKYRDRLYNEKRLQPERKTGKQLGNSEAATWVFSSGLTFTPRRHHLGPPVGMEERRVVMYSGRRDHIRLAEIQAEKKKRKGYEK
jgi:hypothetical protein